jgi:EAL domain-containing protein (putative c-di-GMP-specific phosphodiesterase class I)
MKKRIFILDDDEAFREDLGELLALDGHDVDGMGDVTSFSLEDLGRYDLLLLDLSLPGLDGTEVIRALSRIPVRPQVVVISGKGEDVLSAVADAARLQGTPILAGFTKPFEPAALLRLVNDGCGVAQGPVRDAARTDGASIAAAIAAAMDRDALAVMFQPKVDARSLGFCGAELLLGNELPGIGRIAVPDLIAAASRDCALMARLSYYTIRAGLQGCRQWHARGYEGAVSINLPLELLIAADTPRMLVRMVVQEGLTPSAVICELTEDALYDRSSESLMALAQLRIAGFGLALDDVGQRQSGLLQLARLPVTELKIDMDLLHRARHSQKAQDIFSALVKLGHRLGMKVVAEGVETAEDLEATRRDTVDLIQGYLIARKMPIGELLAWLTAQDEKQDGRIGTDEGDRDERAGAGSASCIAGG